jgi:hypothetical protein
LWRPWPKLGCGAKERKKERKKEHFLRRGVVNEIIEMLPDLYVFDIQLFGVGIYCSMSFKSHTHSLFEHLVT